MNADVADAGFHHLLVDRVDELLVVQPPGILGRGIGRISNRVPLPPIGVELGNRTLHFLAPSRLEVRSPDDFDKAFEDATRARAGALTIMPGPLFGQNLRRIVDFAAKRRLPSIFHVREFVDAGGLVSYGPDRSDLFRRAAAHVDKILRGAKPGDLPVEQPTKFELIINLKTAKALGLTIPPALLLRADEVIQ